MLRVPCYVKFNEYLEKLRTKPPRERERIAVIATGVSFAIIFLIWLVSFNEMNKAAQPQAEEQPAQLEDLKNNFSGGKNSIEEMIQSLPDQSGAAGADNAGLNNSGENNPPAPADSSNAGNTNSDEQNKESVPQLP